MGRRFLHSGVCSSERNLPAQRHGALDEIGHEVVLPETSVPAQRRDASHWGTTSLFSLAHVAHRSIPPASECRLWVPLVSVLASSSLRSRFERERSESWP